MSRAWWKRYLHHSLWSDEDQPLAFLARIHGCLEGRRHTLGPGSLRIVVTLEYAARVRIEIA